MNRVLINNLVENEETKISGWAKKVRDTKYMIFVVLEDRSGSIQVSIDKENNKDIVKDLEGCDGIVEMYKADVTNRDEVDAMVEYAVKEFGGIDVVALGSDFDGIENKVEISDVSEMGKLAIELEKEGFTTTEIEKIYYKNALRVIKDVL